MYFKKYIVNGKRVLIAFSIKVKRLKANELIKSNYLYSYKF